MRTLEIGKTLKNGEKEVYFYAGNSIEECVEELVALANEYNYIFCGDFNGIKIEARPSRLSIKEQQNKILKYFRDESDRKRKEYLKSPEYKAQKAKEEKELIKMKEEMVVLMEDFKKINYKDYKEVVNWLYKAQPYINKKSIVSNQNKIVDILINRGYKINENTGEDFKEDDEENFARYLIGQAMDNLKKVGAIHPMIKSFSENWKEKFNIE